MNCPRCNREVTAGSRHCPQCGKAIPQESTSRWKVWVGLLIGALIFVAFAASMILATTDIADSMVKPTSTPFPPITPMPPALPVRDFAAMPCAADVTFSQDGTMLATICGSGDWRGEIRLWQVATGELIRAMRTQDSDAIGNRVFDVAFAPDGDVLANGQGGQVKLWRISDGALLHTLQSNKEAVKAVAFSPDGSILASGGEPDKTIRLWRASDGAPLRTLTVSSPVSDLAFSPDGTVLAAVSSGIALLRVSDGQLLHTLSTGGENLMIFSSDGISLLIGLSRYDDLALWRIENGARLSGLKISNGLRTNALSPSGVPLAFEPDGQTIRIKRVYDGTSLGTFEGQDNPPSSLTLSPDDTLLASGGIDGQVRIWNAFTSPQKSVLATLPTATPAPSARLLYNLEGTKSIASLVTSLAFSPDRSILASGSGDHTIKLWQVRNGELLRTLEGHADSVLGLDFSPDGKYLVSASSDKTVRLWRTDSWDLVRVFEGFNDWVMSASFLHDSDTLIIRAKDGKVQFWRIDEERPFQTLEGEYSTATLSPDETTLAVASSNTVQVRRMSDNTPFLTLEGHNAFKWKDESIRAMFFSPDGRTLITGGWEIRLWDLSSGNLIQRIIPGSYTDSFALAPDGKMLATGADRLHLWLNGECHHAPEVCSIPLVTVGDSETRWAVTYSSDSTLLAAAAGKRVEIWKVE